MVHSFSDREALRIAAEIERKGARFYRMAQGVAKDGPAYNLLEMLRAQEEAHAQRFEAMLNSREQQDDEEDGSGEYDLETNAFLSAIAAEVVFPGGVLASLMNKKLETVSDILLHAISSEKDSLLFYMELLNNANDAEYRKVFEEIIREEKSHLCDLQRLLEAVRRA